MCKTIHCLAILLVLTLSSKGALAQEGRCPHRSDHACNQWHLEQSDAKLEAAVEAKLRGLEHLSPSPEKAKQALLEAQKDWMQFRHAECAAAAAAHIGAAPAENVTSGCLVKLTRQRIRNIESMLPVYFIAEIEVKDPQGYRNEYAVTAHASMTDWGGRYIALGGGEPSRSKLTPLNGDPPKRVVVMEWDSLEQFRGWYNSPEYTQARSKGEMHATFRTYLVEAASYP